MSGDLHDIAGKTDANPRGSASKICSAETVRGRLSSPFLIQSQLKQFLKLLSFRHLLCFLQLQRIVLVELMQLNQHLLIKSFHLLELRGYVHELIVLWSREVLQHLFLLQLMLH